MNQQEQLERVYTSIGDVVMAFCLDRWPVAPRFHMETLLAWVRARWHIAPDSPSRILRELRLRRRIDYRVVNRRESLYELTAVHGENARKAEAA